jgi:hypothetical protein
VTFNIPCFDFAAVDSTHLLDIIPYSQSRSAQSDNRFFLILGSPSLHLERVLGSISRLLGGIGGQLVGFVHFDGVSGIDGERDEYQNLQDEFGVSKTALRPYFKVAKASFYFCCAFIFAALGFIHIQSIALNRSGRQLLGALVVGLILLCISVLFNVRALPRQG